MSFWEYELKADILHIGERIKKGTFRPMVPAFKLNGNDKEYRPIPYSAAAGALREFLGLAWDVEPPIHAAGYLTSGTVESLVIAPRDNVTGISKLPITVQFLADVKGKLFILVDKLTENLPPEFKMVMGGMRYKGLGLCHLTRVSPQSVETVVREGKLLTRIPETALDKFGIDVTTVKKDGPYRWGYLFKPTSITGGIYVKSLFEGSEVKAFSLFLGGTP